MLQLVRVERQREYVDNNVCLQADERIRLTRVVAGGGG